MSCEIGDRERVAGWDLLIEEEEGTGKGKGKDLDFDLDLGGNLDP